MDKKVYITALHMMHGGVEMSISLIANALVKRGYEVEILSIYNLGTPAYKLMSGVKLTYLTDLKPNREEFNAALKTKNIFKIVKEGLDAVRVLNAKKKSMIKAIRKIEEGTIISTRNEHSVILSHYGNKNVKKIAQLHHDHKFDRKIIKDFQNNYTNIDYFVLLTELLAEEVREFMENHNTKTKCICIPNFLENRAFDQNIKKEKQVIAVGRLHEVKGFDRLIDIWSIVTRECPQWKLKIVGGGDEEYMLRNKISELSLDDTVILTGSMDHDTVMKEICKSGVFVMTSHSEGFPFVLIEALMCSTPIIAFDVRVGPRAIIDNGKVGYLIADNKLNDFALRLINVIKNESLMKELGECAKTKSKEFMEESVIVKWLEIL